MQPEALQYLYDIREAALKIRRFTDGKAEPVGTSGSIHHNGDDIAIWDVD